MFCYSAFGLHLRSNLPLPGLTASADPRGAPAVDLRLGCLPSGLEAAGRRPVFTTEGLDLFEVRRHTLFVYADGVRCAVAGDGSAVWADWPAALGVDDAALYLLGPVMAFVLRLQGRMSLHAGVFRWRGAAWAVAGGPEAGKSTLTAALAKRGVPVLSDDVAPLVMKNGRFRVSPSQPRVRLWADSADHLFAGGVALPLLTPNWDKRFLDLRDTGLFEDEELPLAGVLILAERAERDAPRVERLAGREGLVAVLAHFHSVWMLPSKPQREIFEVGSRLAERVPLLRLVPPDDPTRLDELCTFVLETVDRLMAAADVVGGQLDVRAG